MCISCFFPIGSDAHHNCRKRRWQTTKTVARGESMRDKQFLEHGPPLALELHDEVGLLFRFESPRAPLAHDAVGHGRASRVQLQSKIGIPSDLGDQLTSNLHKAAMEVHKTSQLSTTSDDLCRVAQHVRKSNIFCSTTGRNSSAASHHRRLSFPGPIDHDYLRSEGEHQRQVSVASCSALNHLICVEGNTS